MRKTIVIMFTVIGLVFGILVYKSGISFVHLASALPVIIPQNVQEDLEYVLAEEDTVPLYISFSLKEHFYNETIYVAISANTPDAEIYYTLDGSEPTNSSERYTQPLGFIAGEDTDCYVLKAAAFNSTGQSPVLTHSYFVGENVHERFSTQYVFSISSQPDGLYGYDNGILVGGRALDEYLSVTADEEVNLVRSPANYNQKGIEWERIAYIEAFSNIGDRIIAQNSGIRVHGDSSRTYPQKSLRLIARREYGVDNNRFRHSFFDNYNTLSEFANPITAHKSLILKNSGTDYYGGRVRPQLVSQIAADAGYPYVTPYSTAAVFINGEYHGYADIVIRINQRYITYLHDIQRKGAVEVSLGDPLWQEPWSEYIYHGFPDDSLSELESYIDIDNFLFHTAIQSYIVNTDWRPGNIYYWMYQRYEEEYYGNKIVENLDERRRYILYDIDNTLGMWSSRRQIGQPSDEMSLIMPEYTRLFLKTLFKQSEYAGIFANYLCDLAFEHFSAENVASVMQQIDDMIMDELIRSHLAYDINVESLAVFREGIIAFAEQRPGYIIADLRNNYGFTDMYKIISDGTCKINTLNGDEGTYFIECNVPVVPIYQKGQVFDYWLVNGEVRYNEDLVISYQDADADGIVYVSLVTSENLPPLIFAGTYDTGELYGFTMYNPTDTVQDTRGLYLSDNIDNLKKWQFPAMNIRPGSVWEFVGRNCVSVDALLKLALNFNPRHGEVIFLSNEQGDILDFIAMKP